MSRHISDRITRRRAKTRARLKRDRDALIRQITDGELPAGTRVDLYFIEVDMRAHCQRWPKNRSKRWRGIRYYFASRFMLLLPGYPAPLRGLPPKNS